MLICFCLTRKRTSRTVQILEEKILKNKRLTWSRKLKKNSRTTGCLPNKIENKTVRSSIFGKKNVFSRSLLFQYLKSCLCSWVCYQGLFGQSVLFIEIFGIKAHFYDIQIAKNLGKRKKLSEKCNFKIMLTSSKSIRK